MFQEEEKTSFIKNVDERKDKQMDMYIMQPFHP